MWISDFFKIGTLIFRVDTLKGSGDYLNEVSEDFGVRSSLSKISDFMQAT